MKLCVFEATEDPFYLRWSHKVAFAHDNRPVLCGMSQPHPRQPGQEHQAVEKVCPNWIPLGAALKCTFISILTYP